MLMLMTGDGVFFAQTWHKSNLPPPRVLFFSSAGTSGGGAETPSRHSPNGPKPKYRQYPASAAPVFAYFNQQQQKVYIVGLVSSTDSLVAGSPV